jgi:UDP-glucose 4-epimerase
MKILIIGSNGFIGSHLSRAIGDLGDVVSADFSTADRERGSSQARIGRLKEIFNQHRPDVCVNCSGAAHVPNSFATPFTDFDRNTVAVYEMLDVINRHSKNTRFVHLSSAAVYGNPKALPVAEDAALEPVSPYGYHKMAAEQFCAEFAKIYGVHSVSLRIFSAFGPGLRKQLFWDTYRKWRDLPEIRLFGTGDETRDFIFIDDLCAAVSAVVSKADFAGECINVASGKGVSIRDAVTMLLRELGGEKDALFQGTRREGDPDRWRADITRLKNLGFEANTTMSEGIRATAKWLKEQK